MDGRLADNIVHFARILRAAGVPVGPGAVVEALRGVELAGIRKREDMFWTLHAVFVTRREHMELFAQAFALFFRNRNGLDQMASSAGEEEDISDETGERLSRRIAEAFNEGTAGHRDREELEADARLTVSQDEVLAKKDFAEMSAAEIAEAKRRVAALVLPVDYVRTRRYAPHRRGLRIDRRASLRAGLRTAGDLIPLARQAPRRRHPPVVAILDISGSMAPYTQLFLHFLHALGSGDRRLSVFLFGTRLTNVTRALRVRDPDEALRRASAEVEDWSGGTRIAAALHHFNHDWSRRVLGQGAVVMLFTDGLEREGGESLGSEMDRLHRSCRRLIWLNPLLSFGGFAARAAGIRAMLPHVDEFRPIHNLESMAGLVQALERDGSSVASPRYYLHPKQEKVG
jgi:uncharacterized protein with von Willebrand factor type A (vWA) domain